jgi:hypothetical protein
MAQELSFWLNRMPRLPANPQDDDLVVFLEDFRNFHREMIEVGVDINTYTEILNIKLEMEANAFPRKYAC